MLRSHITRIAAAAQNARRIIVHKARLPSLQSRCQCMGTTSQSSVDELFSCTSRRWLYNEKQQQSVRFTPFNVAELEDIAVHAVGAKRCLSWTKIGEGGSNKAFLLRFENEREVVVRVPCPVIGNVERTIVSEVATMKYVSERWGGAMSMPIPPQVIAWNSSYSNTAGIPYIIYEYAPGVPLSVRWDDIAGKTAAAAIGDIVLIELFLLSQPFSQCGSIYFTDDVSEEHRKRPLYQDSETQPETESTVERYRIGPTADRDWYRGRYATVSADRGPWPDLQTLIQCAARFQLQAIDDGLIEDYPALKSKPSDVALLRRLLEMTIKVAPLIIPDDDFLTEPVLNHPDLSLDNLIVPPEGDPHISHAVDWQFATVSPFCIQAGLPRGIVYDEALFRVPDDDSVPPWPANFELMSPEEQAVLRVHHKYACRHRTYRNYFLREYPTRKQAWLLPHFSELANITNYVLRCLANGPFGLYRILLMLLVRWDSIAKVCSAAAADPCPIDFSEEELKTYSPAMLRLDEYEKNVQRLRQELSCARDGEVTPSHYKTAKALMEQRRKEWDEEKMQGPFPFYEGAPSDDFT